MLARHKGIKIVTADMDAYEHNIWTRLAGVEPDDIQGFKKALLGTGKLPDTLDHRYQGRREVDARNIVKDEALAQLASGKAEAAAASGHKPKLVVLWGGWHKVRLDKAFGDLGLEAKVRTMEQSAQQERIDERLGRIVMRQMQDEMAAQ
jgi:hypothetical protein